MENYKLHQCEGQGKVHSGIVRKYKNPQGIFILCESCADLPIIELVEFTKNKNAKLSTKN